MELDRALERAVGRPTAFEPHDARFWDDPYIGTQLLAAHLDPSTEAASHPLPTIERRVEHLVTALALRPGDRLLDLGCGPGLYAEAFARRGLAVVGLDLSPVSIAYARACAKAAGSDIEYRLADYTSAQLGGPFDAAVLVYLDFGVLADAARDRLLMSVVSALRPGGRFCFDVKGPGRQRVEDRRVEVSRQEAGFWRPGPHLVVETTYRYPSNLDLSQYAIVEPDDTLTVYRVWDRAYSIGQLRRLLERHGLAIEAVWSDLAGDPWRRDAATLAVAARAG